MTLIGVVIPTVRGREDHYTRCVDAYRARSVHALHIITERDRATCGEAWNEGAARAAVSAQGLGVDYLHFSADDLEPHEGWDVAAIEAVERGFLPAPRIVNPAGHLDYCGEHRTELPDWSPVQMSVIPFMPRSLWQQIGPVPSIHYFSDNYVSWRAAQAGWPTVVRRGFGFTHHWAAAGRGAGMSYEQRMAHDKAAFLAAMAGAVVG